MNSALRTRIAPTPSGFLHPGNAVSFLISWAFARANKGKLLLRIDDLDAARMRQEYLDDIFFSLEWLGIDYDEGPAGPDDFRRNYSQQLRLDLYQTNLELLKNSGHLFTCICSRKEIRTLSKNGLYPGTCREKNLPWDTANTSWRLRVEKNTLIEIPEWRNKNPKVSLDRKMGDIILKQKNGYPAYQIASIIDDLHWGINFIVRGNDLLESSAAQLYISTLLGKSSFLSNTFLHHNLLKDSDGEKLSKSKGAGSLKYWREEKKSPITLYQHAGQLLGLKTNQINSRNDLIALLANFSEDYLNDKKNREWP